MSAEIDEEPARRVRFEAVAQMVVRSAQESCAMLAALHLRVEHVVGADFQRRRIERLVRAVVQRHFKTAKLVVLESAHDVRCVLDSDWRVFLGDLQVVRAVGILLDALAEQQADSRVVDPLLVAIPVAVATKRNFSDSMV